jgi:hypothetical protein
MSSALIVWPAAPFGSPAYSKEELAARSPHLPVQFHAFHPSALCPFWQNALLLPDFYSGGTGLSGRFSEGFLHRRSHSSLTKASVSGGGAKVQRTPTTSLFEVPV